MIEKELLNKFLDKKIVFCWQNNQQKMFSVGILREVTDSSILIDFKGTAQVYDLDSIISVKEYIPRGLYHER